MTTADMARRSLSPLAPPPWEYSPSALATDAGFHLVYGLAAAIAFRALR